MNKENILRFLKEHVGILIMNLIIFVILFFLIPLLFNVVNPYIWRVLFLLVIIVTTSLFYIFNKIKYEHVLYSLPILFILNLIIIKYCTIRDLYGITAHGNLDKAPAIIDALLVDIVIVFIEYITLFITRLINNVINKNKKIVNTKEEKIEKKEDNKKEEKQVVKKTTSKKTITKKSK